MNLPHFLGLGYFISGFFLGVSESSRGGLEQMNFSSTRGKTIFEQTKQYAFYFALGVHVVDIT